MLHRITFFQIFTSIIPGLPQLIRGKFSRAIDLFLITAILLFPIIARIPTLWQICLVLLPIVWIASTVETFVGHETLSIFNRTLPRGQLISAIIVLGLVLEIPIMRFNDLNPDKISDPNQQIQKIDVDPEVIATKIDEPQTAPKDEKSEDLNNVEVEPQKDQETESKIETQKIEKSEDRVVDQPKLAVVLVTITSEKVAISAKEDLKKIDDRVEIFAVGDKFVLAISDLDTQDLALEAGSKFVNRYDDCYIAQVGKLAAPIRQVGK